MQLQSLELFLAVASALILLSVFASKASGKFGLPSLLLFLGLGMVAGTEGIGKIAFSDYSLAFAIGSVALAIILFDGGLRTPWASVRPFAKAGISLSFLGVVFTASAVGAFVHFIFKLPWPEALLLGSIISSTDAAAVFSVLRSKNLTFKKGLKEVLEFEAGSNDPAAIFLTITFLEIVMAQNATIFRFLTTLLSQVGIGLFFGFFGAKATKFVMNTANLDHKGLYHVVGISFALLIFGTAASLGGSGFLAVYVAGIILGNSNFLHKDNFIRFQDGISWMAQILLFLTLGLLVFPSHVLSVWKQGLAISLFLMFIARPLSVMLGTIFSKIEMKQKLFISWVGLRGAAPILLATVPATANFEKTDYFFNIIFFVVIVSVLVQGTTIPWLASKLKLLEEVNDSADQELEIEVLPQGFHRVELTVAPGSLADNSRLVDLELPKGVLLTNMERKNRFLVPSGATKFRAGDKVWGLARPSNTDQLNLIFGSGSGVVSVVSQT